MNQTTTLYGVYHANGGLIGEFAYMLGKLMGASHCALCDISHGGFKEKEAFRACMARLPVTLEVVHLNEQSRELAAFTQGKTPCVVMERDNDYVLVLTAEDLDSCNGEVVCFERKLLAYLTRQN